MRIRPLHPGAVRLSGLLAVLVLLSALWGGPAHAEAGRAASTVADAAALAVPAPDVVVLGGAHVALRSEHTTRANVFLPAVPPAAPVLPASHPPTDPDQDDTSSSRGPLPGPLAGLPATDLLLLPSSTSSYGYASARCALLQVFRR